MLFHSKISKEQFTDLWQASKDKFYRFAFCYVKNEADALEILSEATYKAYSSFEKLKNPEHFNSWMGRIIINASIDFINKNKKFVPIEDNVIEISKQNEIEQLEDKIDVYALLELVSPEAKSLLILKYFEEKSFKEIAEILEMPENTVKTKIYRTLGKLKELIERNDIL